MFVRKIPYIIFREGISYGYLTDNRNFGYDTASKSSFKLGDLLLSREGNIFYSMLRNEFQSIDEITSKLATVFSGVMYQQLFDDARDFYIELSKEGFAVCVSEIDTVFDFRSSYFSYKNTKPFILNIEKDEPIKYKKIFSGTYNLSRVHVDISSKCNERCVHCYIPAEKKCTMMSEEVFDKVLTQCIDMKVLNITLSGGEPMLNPHIKSFLQKCTDANFSINILSNLTNLTEELLEIIVFNPLISIQTSLYAMNEDIHDSITRKKGSYQKTMQAIKRLHDLDIPMQINCPIMKQNYNYYHAVLDFAASLNVEASADFSLFGCYDLSGENIGCRICASDVEKILHENYMNATVYQEEMILMEQKKVADDDAICSVCKSSLCISNTGDVYPCEGWQRMILGNINSSTLKYIWEEVPITQSLRELKYRDFEKCGKCQVRKYCTTCLIMNANDAEGDYKKVNPYMCELAKMKKKVVEEKTRPQKTD